MRLIDADDFYERIEYDTDLCAEMEKDGLKALKKYLDLQPTAYDVDKIIEELKEFLINYGVSEKSSVHQRIIKIVKQGGVSDDVCEWSCDEYGRWHTECHYLADNDPLEYTYCPYCGKKIKIVGGGI